MDHKSWQLKNHYKPNTKSNVISVKGTKTLAILCHCILSHIVWLTILTKFCLTPVVTSLHSLLLWCHIVWQGKYNIPVKLNQQQHRSYILKYIVHLSPLYCVLWYYFIRCLYYLAVCFSWNFLWMSQRWHQIQIPSQLTVTTIRLVVQPVLMFVTAVTLCTKYRCYTCGALSDGTVRLSVTVCQSFVDCTYLHTDIPCKSTIYFLFFRILHYLRYETYIWPVSAGLSRQIIWKVLISSNVKCFL